MSSTPSPRSSKTRASFDTGYGDFAPAKSSSEVVQSSSQHTVDELNEHSNLQTKIVLKAIPFQPGYGGTPAVVTVTDVGNVFVAFDKSTNGAFVAQISLTSLLDGPVVYKVGTTEKDMFECHPSLGILQGNGQVTISVTTGLNKVGWGDVCRQLFLVQSVPVEIETNDNDKPKTAPITDEVMDEALKLFWSEDEEMRSDTDMLLLTPKANCSSFAAETSYHAT